MTPVVVALIFVTLGIVLAAVIIARAIRGEPGLPFPVFLKFRFSRDKFKKLMVVFIKILGTIITLGILGIVFAGGYWNDSETIWPVTLISIACLIIIYIASKIFEFIEPFLEIILKSKVLVIGYLLTVSVCFILIALNDKASFKDGWLDILSTSILLPLMAWGPIVFFRLFISDD